MDGAAALRGTRAETSDAAISPVAGSQAVPGQPSDNPAYPVDTGPAIAQLIHRFERDGLPLQVSFRELVPWIKVGERATHYLHSYPAKLLPQIAHFFLASQFLGTRADAVLDPFAGAGTVPLEAILSGRRALYADVNPLATLITDVKTRPLNDQLLGSAASLVRQAYARSRARTRPDVVNLQHWYAGPTVRDLVRLRAAIGAIDDEQLRALFQVTFSAIARKASRADPRFSVPVRRRDCEGAPLPDVSGLFEQQLDANRQRLRGLARLLPANSSARAECVGDDARALMAPDGSPLLDGSVGMIITSPPYAGAQKYVRSASLSLGWLGLAGSGQLTALERRTIGREHLARATVIERLPTGIEAADRFLELTFGRNPLRAAIAANYLIEMRAALAEAVRVLRPGGHMVLVIGDNTVCGDRFASSEYLRQMLEELGMTTRFVVVDDIKSRGLITRRAATAGVITKEWVILLRKGDGDA